MERHKNKQTGIRSLIYANLGLMCLVSCSTAFQPRPKEHSLKSAAVVSANPGWLTPKKDSLIAAMRASFHSADLFPKELINYSPPRQVVKKQVISANYDIRKDSGVTAQQLNSIFKGKMRGKGESVIRIARKFSIDPLFISGLIIQESGFSGNSRYARQFNNVAGQLKKTKSGKYVPIQFESVEECIERVCSRMRTVYIKENRVTIQLVRNKYCPLNAANDRARGVNSFWLSGILSHMKKIQSV